MLREHLIRISVLSLLASVPALAGRVELLSKKGTLGSPQVIGTAGGSDISADGRFVAFLSSSPNLVPGQSDGNGGDDVFLWDRNSGGVRLVSHADGSAITAANGIASLAPSISADGRWIAFCSSGANLIPGQQPPPPWVPQQAYLYDRIADTITLVSRSITSPLSGGNYESCRWGLDLSSDGRYLAFYSEAGDLLSPEVPIFSPGQVYLYDRVAAQLTLMSHAAGNGTQRANSASRAPSISADGRWIAYASRATDLAAGVTDGNSEDDVFLFDRMTGSNALVTHASGSLTTAANRESYFPKISADGAWIAFSSGASNLAAGQIDGNSAPDVFLWERATGTARLVSHAHSSATTTGNSSSGIDLSLSSDGAWIAYTSGSSDLDAGVTDWNSTADVYLFDRSTGANTLVSHAAGAAAAANGSSRFPVLAQDASRVVFTSDATDLAAGATDGNGTSDLLAWTRSTGNVTLVSHAQGSPAVAGNGSSSFAVLAADGLSLVFGSSASDLVSSADMNGGSDLFHHHLGTGATTAISFSPPVVTASASGSSENLYRLVTSADGRFTVFQSTATDLIPGQVDANSGGQDIFLYDRGTSLTTLVSHSAGSPTTTANDDSSEVAISRDGRFVAFISYATDLVPGQISGGEVFLYDRVTGSTVMVSHTQASPTTGFCVDCTYVQISGDGSFLTFIDGFNLYLYARQTDTLTPIHPGKQVTALALSTDGRYLAFMSNATNIVPGQADSNGGDDIFLYDRIAGTTLLVSRNASSAVATGNAGSHNVTDVSADGRFVLFISPATDHVPGQVDANGQPDLFLFDRSTGAVSLVSHTASSLATAGDGATQLGVISRDGRSVAFMSSATNLVAGQQNASPGGVFLFDRGSGSVSLVSHLAGSLTTSGGGRIPAISGDGSRIAFVSAATGLIPGIQDYNGGEDVFLYDRSSGSLELVSHTLATPGVAGNAAVQFRSAISEDGRIVIFSSGASDLVADDYNLNQDVFAFVPEDLDFYVLAPCRLFDSRRPQDGPALNSGVARILAINGACGIPATAKTLEVNVTVVLPGSSGYLTLYPGDGLPPLASTLNFGTAQTRTNNATVRLAPSGSGTLAVRPVLAGGGSVHVVIDVVGYFE